MADRSITALTPAEVLNSSDLFVLSQSNQAKSATWQLIISYLTTALDGHGGIQSIEKTGTSGLVDTYTVTLADEAVYTFTVTNAKSITKIEKTGTSGLVDTYTITYNDSNTATFTVTNGKAISTIVDKWAVSSSNSTAPSTWYTTLQTMTPTDKYLWHYQTITFNDNTTLDTDKAVVGVYGDTGQDWYVYIKYSSAQPTQDSDMGDIPDNWIGLYSGTEDDVSNLHYIDFSWFQYKGSKGDTGDAAEITSQAVEYQEGTSGTVAPSGTWTTTIPTVAQGNYLWTRTTLNFNDGSTVTSYSIARMGVDGTGSVSSVNSQSPDGNGNIALDADHIPTDDNTSVQARIEEVEEGKADQIMIAGVEDSSTAANSYTVGQHLILSGALYYVTAAITAGDTITDSGGSANVRAATVGGELTGLGTSVGNLKADIGIVEDGNTCTHSGGITAGQYVIWKGQLYIASTAIAEGATLASGTNLTPKTEGGLNDLRNSLNQLALIGNTTAINQNGTYTKENVTGMTANHKVANWGLFSDANLTTPISPNNPPADITIAEESGGYVITIANYTSAFYMKPIFILPQN